MIFLNIGSNLNSKNGSRIYNLSKSLDLISLEKIKIKKISKVYETPSYPNQRNPKFLNLCVEIETKFLPDELIKKFNLIEKKLNRIRGLKNEPRTCDIDLVDYKKKVINSEGIILPHPRAHLRNFVLFPLKEICPNWIHPVLNKNIDFLIKKLSLKLRNEITTFKERVIFQE